MKRTIFALSASLALALGLLLAVLALTGTPAIAAPNAITPIYDIQYTTHPSGDSPLVGQVVTTTGIVYAVYSGRGFCIADASGPWHGIYVYYPSGTMPNLGDEVRATGTVEEYYNLTELGDFASYTVLSSGNPVYAPSVVTAAQIEYNNSASEPYESVFVEVHDIEVTAGADAHGVWTFTDGSAGTGQADDWGYHLEPDVGDKYAILRGALIYWYNYVVMPRDADDVIQGAHLAIQKDAPTNVAPGTLLTYTITVLNNTGLSLTQVVVTDTIPTANATFAYALDGGVLSGNVISWTATALPSSDSLSVRFAVTATGSAGEEIWNDAYTVWATNWPTPTFGAPLLTIIGDYIPIYQIQGTGFESPYDGQVVKTVGVVAGFFEGNYPGSGNFDGFFIQDSAGDGITTTSDGIFVNYGTLAVSVNAGDVVTVTGEVQEFNEYDGAACSGNECLTQIAVSDAGDVQASGTGTITPTILDPPGDPDDAAVYWEALEGMSVTLPMTGVVVGPTSYGTIAVVPEGLGITHALRTGPYAGMAFGVRHYERYGDIGSGDPPNLIVGSEVDNVSGPLGFSYGSYLVVTQYGNEWQVVYSQPEPSPVPTWPSAGVDEFTVLTFNVENFFDDVDDPGVNDDVVSSAEYECHRDKIAATIVTAGCPIIVGVQEAEKLAVLQYLADELYTQGCTYTAVLSEGLDGRGIDVGYMVLDDRATVEGVSQYQDCTTYDTGLGQGDCPSGQQLLFSRLPLVMTATMQIGPQPDDTTRVTFIVNHLKSKRSRSGDPESAQWRLLQAQSLAQLADQIISADPNAHLIVLGDLNDFEDSLPLEALYTTGHLTNTWYTLPPEARYDYIYRGVSQILDHILISPAMQPWLRDIEPLHYNADFPYKPYAENCTVVWHTSDHDPVATTFGMPAAPYLFGSTKTVTPTTTAAPHDLLTYTITLRNWGLTATVTLTDTLPAGLDLVRGLGGSGLVWSDTISLNQTAILTLVARVRSDAPHPISANVALLDDGTNPVFALRSPQVQVLYRLYLPLVRREG